jgi:hypothetical protein
MFCGSEHGGSELAPSGTGQTPERGRSTGVQQKPAAETSGIPQLTQVSYLWVQLRF